MNNNEIARNLEDLTVSRLTAVSKLYRVDCSTSNIVRLHKALKQVVNEAKRTEVKTTVEVEHDEVIDMFNTVEEGIKAYKIKYSRSTFPKDLNIYQLIEDFRKLSPPQIIREVLKGKEDNRTNLKVNSKTRKGEIDFDKLIENEMKLGLL
ncbi:MULTISPECIES: hypothetical protein [Sphingobacterium]|uniref:hypothetical protein n=1 Tax=Sphingobacterium TaxID=28453 RepID=UPI002580DC00|nr:MULTISPECIES: hypothetical protein [Sphingobacterium]